MNKRIQSYGSIAFIGMVWMSNASALTGNMFQVTSTGAAATIPIKLCLSAGNSKPNSQSGCETFTATGTTLGIRLINLKASQAVRLSACPTYSNVGLQVLDSNYTVATGGTLNSATGYYAFSANCSADSTVTLTPTTGTATLTASVSELALSVSGLTEYGVTGGTSGKVRRITITNTGNVPATNLSVNNPSFPAGTSITTTCTNTLLATSSCTITITPGTTASSGAGGAACSTGIAPNPTVVSVSADNAATVSTNVFVLGYGCQYKGGYVYAFDDTTAATQSVAGKVVTTTDQAQYYPNGVIWSSNGTGGASANFAYDIIYGISEISTTSSANPNTGQVTGQVACDGKSNGACNSNNIIVYYSYPNKDPAINLSYYAAGLCKQTIETYSDWYLPAICEMGYTVGGGQNAVCGTSTTPTLQNIQKSLIDTSGLAAPAGDYWSSTEYSLFPQSYAWYQFFGSGGSYQLVVTKNSQLGVRCSRAF